ncbi:acyl-CoA dehydrogenase family protein [Streptomyces sp. NBRC 109706]|uniref:acyl-CoA dehydrogenase family protein n=1 Tax=Streptomyces sp. NBRC 109706 TaxID=1550035 RepID=UPI000782E900|nr:acyl-CoA dehydrogenase family protein [Streptomyces sp. NBRC 109706]
MADTTTSPAQRPGRYELDEELTELRALAREIAQREFRDRALDWERNGEFPWRNIALLAETGLLGVALPERYGGGGGSWLHAAVVLEELGACCYTTAMAALGELGVQTQAILHYGSEELRQKYLPGVVAGRVICAICMTEPDSGSDLSAMTTTVREDGDSLVLNGRKTLISRADVAQVFVVFTRFADDTGRRSIGAVVVDRDTPGLRVAERFSTLGGEGLYGVVFDDCRVPAGNLLVREDGFRKMLHAFNGQRCLNAAISVGIARGANEAALEHARGRVAGGQLLGAHQGIRWILADNAIQIEAARLLVHRAAAQASDGFPQRYESAVAKTFANEMALKVTDNTLQLFGGHGWIDEVPAERYLRWARYGPLGGGTPHIQRNGIARHLLGEL